MFIGMLIVYLLIKIGLLGVGIGIGFLLHWMLPAVDLGTGILIGVLATGVAIHLFTRLMGVLNEHQKEDLNQKIGAKVKIYSLDAIASRRKAKQKSST